MGGEDEGGGGRAPQILAIRILFYLPFRMGEFISQFKADALAREAAMDAELQQQQAALKAEWDAEIKKVIGISPPPFPQTRMSVAHFNSLATQRSHVWACSRLRHFVARRMDFFFPSWYRR